MRRDYVCGLAALLMITLVTACHATGERFVTPVIQVRKLSRAELAGVSVEKAVWKRPLSVAGFVKNGANGYPTQQTQLRAAYDNTNLYFAFRCFEQHMDKLSTKYNTPDSFNWRDDSISMLLSPGKDPGNYVHLCSNTAGGRFDERSTSSGESPGVKWNGKWSIKIAKKAAEWTAFVTVPFSDVGVSAPKPGTVWAGNFLRRSTPSDERSFWSPTSEGFQLPEWWGQIVFGDEKTPVVTVSAPDMKAPGTYTAVVRVSNPGKAKLGLELVTFSGREPVGKVKLTAKPGNSEHKASYKLGLEGRLQFGAAVRDTKTGKTLTRMGAVLTRIPDNKTRITRYARLVREHNPPNPTAAAEKQYVLKELESLSREANAAMGNATRWTNLISKVDEVEKKVARVRCICADKSAAGYAVGTENSLTKIRFDKLFEGEFGTAAKVSGCRNEFESVQVVICNGEKALSKVNVSASALTGPNGATIPADRVGISIVDYVKTRKPRYEVDHIGWYPDPLLENKPFDVDAGSVQPVWVTVHVPTGIPAGLYKGAVTIKPEGADETTMPLEVNVWNFDLPVKHTFKTAFALFPHEIGAWWGGDSDEKRLARYKFLLEHRISPTNIYTPSPLPAMGDIPFCVENGMNQMCLVYTHNKDAKNREKLAETVREYETYLKEHGWWDMAYLYGFDEIPPEKYPELVDMYGWVKKTFPDLPRMCTVIPNKDLKGSVDVWVPVTSNWKQDVAEQYVKDGGQVWWYVCVTPDPPYANFFIDEPGVDPRVLFWQCWKYKIPGFLYYAINLWESNRSLKSAWADPHPFKDWNLLTIDVANGDGILVYPGPEGRFLSSMRFEAIRDGIEDWECLNILEQEANLAEFGVRDISKIYEMKPFKPRDLGLVVEARKLLKVRSDVVKSVTEYTQDPEVLLKARAEVAEMIEKLNKQRVESGK